MRSLPTLAAGGVNTASKSVTIPTSLTPGSYYFCAIADPGNTVKEGNENNNALAGNQTTLSGI